MFIYDARQEVHVCLSLWCGLYACAHGLIIDIIIAVIFRNLDQYKLSANRELVIRVVVSKYLHLF